MAGGMGNEVALAMRNRGASFSLDENLWGGLQQHLCLAEHVYARLPFEEFFNLRTVCKDWYNVACNCLALEDRILEPVFALFTRRSSGENLEGFLSYKPSLNSLRWSVYSPDKMFFDLFESTDGTLVYHSGYDQSVCCMDVKHEHFISRTGGPDLLLPPVPEKEKENTILGIMRIVGPDNFAEKCLKLYKDYMIVRGGQGFDTQVYDSRTGEWQTKPCRPKPEMKRRERQVSIGSVDCNGRVYITSEHSREISVYDFESACSSSLKSPCQWISELPQHSCLDKLWTWNGRVFDVGEDSKPGRSRSQRGSLCVWELLDGANLAPECVVYSRLPKDLYSWRRSFQAFHPLFTKAINITVEASFSGDYMVVYSWDFRSERVGRFCLFNVATKNWEKLVVPVGKVMNDSD